MSTSSIKIGFALETLRCNRQCVCVGGEVVQDVHVIQHSYIALPYFVTMFCILHGQIKGEKCAIGGECSIKTHTHWKYNVQQVIGK